jgi:autotransporter-associated beta strand protein
MQLLSRSTLRLFICAWLSALCSTVAIQAQVVLSGTSYTQNFNSLGDGLPSGWSVRTGAGATALGTAADFTNTNTTSWADTAGRFKNLASATGLISSSTATVQGNSVNRALGIRQTGTFGDPGASFNFNFDSTNFAITGLSIDLMMLSVQDRSITWSLQYGVGATPGSWSTLSTWSDPGTFGTTNFSFTDDDFGSAMNDAASVWFRVVALSSSTGTGSRDTMAIDNFSLSFSALAGSIISRGAGTLFTPNSFGGNAFTADDTALFDGTAVEVELDGNVIATKLTFETDGYSLAGGVSDSITAPTIEVVNGSSALISGIIAGSSGLIKTGEGSLILDGNNTFTGNVSINEGMLIITSDSNLGDSNNNIIIADTLATVGDIVLGAGRDLSGNGTLALDGNLTIQGDTSFGTMTYDLDGNTLTLDGASNTVSTLGLVSPGNLQGNTLSVSSVIQIDAGGTVTVDNAISFGAGTRTISTADGSTLVFDGDISSTSGRIIFSGSEGTVVLNGDNSGIIGGIRIGEAGATPSSGGKVQVSNVNALGATALTQFNYGELENISAGELAFSSGLSIGGRIGSEAVLSGEAMVFEGQSEFFRGTGTSGQLALVVNNTTNFSGGFVNGGSVGGGSSTGITLGGSGIMILNGDNSELTETLTLADSLTLLVNSTSIQALGSSVIAQGGTTLGGSGIIVGSSTIQAGATLAPGNSTGELTFGNDLTLADGSFFEFEFLNSSNYDQVAVEGTLFIPDQTGLVLVTIVGLAGFDLNLMDSFTIFTAGTIDNGGDIASFSVANDLTGWSGGWSFTQQGNAIILTAIPEPRIYGLLAGLVVFAWVMVRRRQTKRI